jgi:RNA ligase
MYLHDLIGIHYHQLKADYIDTGFITQQKHPTLPLIILNYTHKTQIERKWDRVTKTCRGLIVAFKEGELLCPVVACPFRKFFNLDEHDDSSTKNFEYAIRNYDRPLFIEKMDGSLGIGWSYYDTSARQYHYGVATRGSFTSPQAIWATKRYNQHIEKYGHKPLNEYAMMFEIIYPENRIVVEYKFSGLVGLGMVHYTGHEENFVHCRTYFHRMGFRMARIYAGLTLEKAKSLDLKNFEGFIAYVAHATPFRAKIKCPDYVRLHKLITGWNPKNVWELLSSGQEYGELLADSMPKHFTDWLKSWLTKLTEQYAAIEQEAKKLFEEIVVRLGENTLRKDFALEFNQHKKLRPILYKMLDNQDYSQVIWKQIKPSGDEKFIQAEGEDA